MYKISECTKYIPLEQPLIMGTCICSQGLLELGSFFLELLKVPETRIKASSVTTFNSLTNGLAGEKKKTDAQGLVQVSTNVKKIYF